MRTNMTGYCGCCGRSVQWTAMWCEDCRPHIKRQDYYDSLPPWERTYFAQKKEG